MKRLSPTPTVHDTAHIEDTALGEWTEVGAHTSLVGSSLGDYSYLTQHVQAITASTGKFCSVASFVRLNPGNHPIERPTSHHLTYRAAQYGFTDEDETEFFAWRRAHPVTLGHDVWIGHSATVLPGTTVGNGAVIGAGAVVTKDVAPYCVVGGVPAKPIKQRFTDEVAETLERTRWWDWSRQELEERFLDLRDMATFLEKYG